jgi:hypothetical protein
MFFWDAENGSETNVEKEFCETIKAIFIIEKIIIRQIFQKGFFKSRVYNVFPVPKIAKFQLLEVKYYFSLNRYNWAFKK